MSGRSGAGVVALLAVSVAINYLDRGVLSVSAPAMMRELALSPVQMGLLLSSFFWTYATFQLVAGWLVDRYEVKWVYAGGFLIWSLATAAVGLAESIGTLVLARLALGIGESVAFPACSRVIVETVPEARRGMANALIDAGAKTGPGLSTLAGGLAVAAFGWRGVFIVVGLSSLVWLVPWLATAPSGSGVRSSGAAAIAWGDLLRHRAVWVTSMGMFAYGYGNYFLLTWLPGYLVGERGLTMEAMAVWGSVPFWTMAVASLAAGWVSDRMVRADGNVVRVRSVHAAIGLAACSVFLLAAPWAESTATAVVWITLAAAGISVFSANVWAITQTLAGPRAAGRWTGIQNFIGNLGGVAAPAATGWIVASTGSFRYAFWTAAAILLSGVAAYGVMLRKAGAGFNECVDDAG